MRKISYVFVTGETAEFEVDEALGEESVVIDDRIRNSDKRETRRHKSLYWFSERGLDLPDHRINTELDFERKEEKIKIHNALKLLTDKQRFVFIAYTVYGESFRKIGDKLGISKVTAREYYLAAVKKMKRNLK